MILYDIIYDQAFLPAMSAPNTSAEPVDYVSQFLDRLQERKGTALTGVRANDLLMAIQTLSELFRLFSLGVVYWLTRKINSIREKVSC